MIRPTAWPGEVPELEVGEVHVWSMPAELVRAALPEVLAAHTGADPHAVRVERTPEGKPFIAEPAGHDLGFNLSHSRELALIAVALGRDVGVDVEAVRPLPRAERIAERVFTPAEVDELRDSDDTAFFRLWVRKEAALKAGTDADVELLDVEVGPGYAAAVALTGPVGGGPRSP